LRSRPPFPVKQDQNVKNKDTLPYDSTPIDFCFASVAILLLPWPTAAAQYNYIDISNPFLRKTPIAVPMFKASAQDPAAMSAAKAASERLAYYLNFTGYFTISDPAAFLEDPQTMNLTGSGIRYRNWTVIGAELLVTGSVVVRDGDAEFELRLFDTVKEKMLVGKRYRGSADDHRQVARRFCSEVVFAITGSRGFFDSKIAFVSNGSGTRKFSSANLTAAISVDLPTTTASRFFPTGRLTAAGSPTPPMRKGAEDSYPACGGKTERRNQQTGASGGASVGSRQV
jgi:hypothetical protein